jgi:pyruvate/2-oxoglutarate/acetoin dehydrogenase E1 component
MRMLSYCDALNEALTQEMERDPSVFIYGLGVSDHKRIFGSTKGLLEKFGMGRCFDTPLSEDAMTGFGLGAAINGLRPIHVHIRMDFLLLAMNQIANMLSSQSYISEGLLKAPMVIRAIIGRGWGQGHQHSKSMYSVFAHIPGLKVVLPTTPYDAKGMLIAAIRDNGPVLFIEHRWLYWQAGEVPEESYVIPIGSPVKRIEGKDVTIVAVSWMNVEAKKAAEILGRRGIKVELIDPRTISPLNEDEIVESVLKTGRCIIADNDWLNFGASAEIATRVYDKCYSKLKCPIERIGFTFAPCPTVRHLENEFYSNAVSIIRTVEKMLGLSPTDLSKEDFYSHERKFKGPF